jgi:membrane-associated phospholipid phosphatase
MAAGTMWILWKRGASIRFRLLHVAVALLIVVSTGALRVIDQAHYASDVLVGATVAGFIPFWVAMLPGKDSWRVQQ